MQLLHSIARILDTNGAIVGAGFIVAERQVLSCAHVIAQALGIPPDSPETPTKSVFLDFPLVAPHKTLSARVIDWLPIRKPSHSEDVAPPKTISARVLDWFPTRKLLMSLDNKSEDLALLELDSDSPQDCEIAHLVSADRLWGHSFRAFGFPTGYDTGVWASGVFRDKQSNGWFQIEDVKATGYRVEQGFSGTPVKSQALLPPTIIKLAG